MTDEYREKYLKYKKKYMSLNKSHQIQSGGSVTPQQEAIADGAGIIFVENYNNHAGRQEPAIILFRNAHNGVYMDAGGTRDQTDRDIKYTASRETIEETANALRINPSSLQSNNAVIHSYGANNYICYFIAVGSIQSTYYRNNLQLLQRQNAPHQWLETNGLTRVYIEDFINAGGLTQGGNLNLNDASGRQITIFGRTKACIRNAIQSYIIPSSLSNNQCSVQMVTLQFNPSYNPRNPQQSFLRGTQCYFT